MLILIGIVFYSIDSMVKTEKWVEHTQNVLTDAALITRSAVDMETGMRGFLLAGDEEFLEPYYSGDKRTFTQITSLQNYSRALNGRVK